MDIILIALGLSTALIFLKKMEWLIDKKIFVINIIYGIILFIVGTALMEYNIGRVRFVAALRMPLVSSLIFFVLLFLFKKIFKRNPENTFWVFTKKPIEDVIFTLLFWLLGVGLPILWLV